VTYRERLAALDSAFPPCGPCLICGGPDKRHRLWDSLESEARVGAGPEALARNYRLSERKVRLIVAAFESARRGHRRLPGQFPLGAA
jgi:hypothetical protein